jgi:hypothetical protein
MNTDKVTRIEVINHQDTPIGKVYTKYDCENVELQLQDDDRTLKIFISGNKKKYFKESQKEIIIKNTWELGLPIFYKNADGDLVEHWRDGRINKIN